jgi:hypothetical protein
MADNLSGYAQTQEHSKVSTELLQIRQANFLALVLHRTQFSWVWDVVMWILMELPMVMLVQSPVRQIFKPI